MKIKILKVKLFTDGRPFKALVDIERDGWIFRGFRVIQQNGQRTFVTAPQVSWKDPESGRISYSTIIDIPPEEKQIIFTEILHFYRMELEKTNVEDPK